MKSLINKFIQPLIAAAFAIILTAPLWIWITKSKLEASAYNRITGSNVSTWEAMWVELRIDGKSK